MSDTQSSALVDAAPVALPSPAQRAAAGRSTALTPATAAVAAASAGRRQPSRRRRAERVQQRQAQRRLRRLLWGGAVVFAVLACLAIGLLLPSQPAADASHAPTTWAGAAGPAFTTGAPATPQAAAANLPGNGPANLQADMPARAVPAPMPTPMPVGRATANPSAGQGLAGAPTAVATPYGAAAAGVVGTDGGGTAQLRGAVVSEADLGIRLAPGSQVDTSAGSRVREPSGSETVMVVASSSDTADRLAAHYRAQLQSTAGGAAVQSYTPGPGQLLLQSVNPTTGVNRAVLIAPQAPGAVTVTLVRAQPAPGTTGP